jgi:5-methylcytosine-specific restriction endonuclease McrA
MKNPLLGLERIWRELDELEERKAAAKERAELEIARLSRNKHRELTLRELYWDPRERIPVMLLAKIFRLAVADVAPTVGELELKTSCLLCSRPAVRRLPNRAARRELEREQGANPKWRICPDCRAFRELDLELLRKKPGERLTAAHRAAYSRYLRTPQWRERRARAIKRAKGKCQLCSSKKGLEAHHRTYIRIGQERDEDITVLCWRCHGGHHGH